MKVVSDISDTLSSSSRVDEISVVLTYFIYTQHSSHHPPMMETDMVSETPDSNSTPTQLITKEYFTVLHYIIARYVKLNMTIQKYLNKLYTGNFYEENILHTAI